MTLRSLIMPLAALCATIVPADGAKAQQQPTSAEIWRLVSEADAEIAAVRDRIGDYERAIAEREDELRQLRVSGGLAIDYDRKIQRLWTRLAFDDAVRSLRGSCAEAFERDVEDADLEFALDCLRDASASRKAPEALSCGSLEWVESFGAEVRLTGYVQDEAELELLSARYGDAIVADVSVRPWPICEALDTLEIPITSDDRPNVRMMSDKTEIRFGESLAFEVRTPGFPAFLYLAYLQADGSVVNLAPRLTPLRRQHSPEATIRYGDGLRGRRTFTAGPPTGPEAIVAISSRSPIEGLEALETGPDGQYWSARDPGRLIDRGRYLEILNDSLKDLPKAELGGRELTAHVLHLTIRP